MNYLWAYVVILLIFQARIKELEEAIFFSGSQNSALHIFNAVSYTTSLQAVPLESDCPAADIASLWWVNLMLLLFKGTWVRAVSLPWPSPSLPWNTYQ